MDVRPPQRRGRSRSAPVRGLASLLTGRVRPDAAARVEPLEHRRLFCATSLHAGAGHPALAVTPEAGPLNPSLYAGPTDDAAPSAAESGQTVPLSALPPLSSRPGAPATLYLDFDGDFTAEWERYRPGRTPALNQDGDASTFSAGEIDFIRDVWARVAEDYAPFNLNVTTVDPGTRADRRAFHVVVGGRSDWYGSVASGLSYTGGFTSELPNTGFVFLNSNAPYTADIIAHEAGHGFGLGHQQVWSGTTLRDPYTNGDDTSRPIMGATGGRSVWWRGTSGSASKVQDDMAVIAGPANGFGYRPDDHGDTPQQATPLSDQGTVPAGTGVIHSTQEQDWFAFGTAGAGDVRIDLDVATVGPNLDARLELRDAGGSVIEVSDGQNLGEHIATDLPAGSYRVGVMSRRYSDFSQARVGDVGTYSLAVESTAALVTQPPPVPQPPPTDPQPPAQPQPPSQPLPEGQEPFDGSAFMVSRAGGVMIQAEDFDAGGQGLAYNDTTPAANSGGRYRPGEGVDVALTGDAGGWYHVSDARPGEWLEYTIDVAAAGLYTLEFRTANTDPGGRFHAEIDGVNVTGSLDIPDTNGFTAFATVSKPGVSLPAGRHVLRVAFDAGRSTDGTAGALNWLRIAPTTAAAVGNPVPPAPTPPPAPVPPAEPEQPDHDHPEPTTPEPETPPPPPALPDPTPQEPPAPVDPVTPPAAPDPVTPPPPPEPPQSVPPTVAAPAVARLTSAAATYVRDGSGGRKKFGTAPKLQVNRAVKGGSREAYLKFDLTSVTGVSSAKLRLHGKLSAKRGGIEVGVSAAQDSNWSEGGITGTSRPAADAAVLAVVTVSGPAAHWYEWDLTEFLAAQKAAGRTEVTLVLRGTAATRAFANFNSDNAPGNRPELVVTA